MKITFESVVFFLFGVLFTAIGISVMVAAICDFSLIGIWGSLFFIAFGLFCLYICYQCFTPNGKYALIRTQFGKKQMINRSRLSSADMKKAFGYDYERYMPKKDFTARLPDGGNTGGSSSNSKSEDIATSLSVGLLLIVVAIFMLCVSDQLLMIVLSTVFIYVGVILLIEAYLFHLMSIGRIGSSNASISSAISGSLIPAMIFAGVGAIGLIFGFLYDLGLAYLIGGVAFPFGLLLLYGAIQSIKPNGTMVTIHTGDGTFVTISKSKLTDKEIDDITDSDGPSPKTSSRVIARNMNLSRIGLIIFIICVAAFIIVTVTGLMNGGINILSLFLLLPVIAMLILYLIAKRRKMKLVVVPHRFGDFGVLDISKESKEDLEEAFGKEYADSVHKQDDMTSDHNNKDPNEKR